MMAVARRRGGGFAGGGPPWRLCGFQSRRFTFLISAPRRLEFRPFAAGLINSVFSLLISLVVSAPHPPLAHSSPLRAASLHPDGPRARVSVPTFFGLSTIFQLPERKRSKLIVTASLLSRFLSSASPRRFPPVQSPVSPVYPEDCSKKRLYGLQIDSHCFCQDTSLKLPKLFPEVANVLKADFGSAEHSDRWPPWNPSVRKDCRFFERRETTNF